MLIRTEAVTLRSIDYGETSQIVTLYTREMGTVAVMAKGARATKSRFGSTLQPMSYIDAVFYHKSTREVQTLSEATHSQIFRRLSRNLERLSTGIRIVETVATLLPHPEPNPAAFELLVGSLRVLEESDGQWQNLLPFFQLQLTALLGFAPLLDRESVEEIGVEGGFLLLEEGQVSRRKPAAHSIPVTRTVIRAMAVLVHAEPATVLRMKLERVDFDELVETVDAYLKYHVPDYRPSKSKVVLDRLRNR